MVANICIFGSKMKPAKYLIYNRVRNNNNEVVHKLVWRHARHKVKTVLLVDVEFHENILTSVMRGIKRIQWIL
jgi:hypothetical protein